MNENETMETETVDETEQIDEIEEIEETAEPVLTEDAEPIPAQAESPADDRAAVEESLRAEIETLRTSLAAAAAAAQRRETEIRCSLLLRERGIGEELTPVLLSPGETAVSEETLQLRVDAVTAAVEAAAVRILREKTDSVRPGAGDPAPLTGKMLRETPVARLMEIMT